MTRALRCSLPPVFPFSCCSLFPQHSGTLHLAFIPPLLAPLYVLSPPSFFISVSNHFPDDLIRHYSRLMELQITPELYQIFRSHAQRARANHARLKARADEAKQERERERAREQARERESARRIEEGVQVEKQTRPGGGGSLSTVVAVCFN